MYSKIPTACGEINCDSLGTTSMHEHVCTFMKHPEYAKESELFALQELKKAKKLGLDTIVEVSPTRDAETLRRISEQSGVNIILCTGYYISFSEEQKEFTVDQFKQYMMEEIENGIGGTGIRPGVIKIASSETAPKGHEKRALIAAGMVQKETGLPMCVHSVTGCKNQQDIFEEAGADLSKVYFSHVEAEFGWEGRTLSQQIDYLEGIIRKGSYLCYNNFGNWAHTREEHLAEIIRELMDRGYSDRQFATMDFVWSYNDGRRNILWEDINPEGHERTYSYLLSHVVPWLEKNGISKNNINAMVRDNCRKIFSR